MVPAERLRVQLRHRVQPERLHQHLYGGGERGGVTRRECLFDPLQQFVALHLGELEQVDERGAWAGWEGGVQNVIHADGDVTDQQWGEPHWLLPGRSNGDDGIPVLQLSAAITGPGGELGCRTTQLDGRLRGEDRLRPRWRGDKRPSLTRIDERLQNGRSLHTVDVVGHEAAPLVRVERRLVRWARRDGRDLSRRSGGSRRRCQFDRLGDALTRLDRCVLAAPRHLGQGVSGEVVAGDPTVIGRPFGRAAQTLEKHLCEDRRAIRSLRLRRLHMGAGRQDEGAALTLEAARLFTHPTSKSVPRRERPGEAAVEEDHLLAGLGVVEQMTQGAVSVQRGCVQTVH